LGDAPEARRGADADAGDPLARAAGCTPGDWGAFLDAASSAAPPGLLVRGGAWEVDLEARRATACYHPAPPLRVRRGTWFLEAGAGAWTPLAEAVADEVETAYAAAPWRRAGDGRGTVGLATPARDAKGASALFAGPDEIYLVRGGWGAPSAGSVSGGRPPGARLRRGHADPAPGASDPGVDARSEAADAADAGVTPTALVLAVHGIGQTMSSSSIADDADKLRRSVAAAAADEPARGGAATAPASPQKGAPGARTPPLSLPTNVAVVPVQWRTHLALDVDAVARAAAPDTVGAIRSTMHATCVEVLLYMTPLHAQDMVDSLVAALNAQHARFVARHPGFGGAVSIVAHSLGSLLAYDVLTAQPASLERLTGVRVGSGGGVLAAPSPPPASPPSLPPDLTDLGFLVSPGTTEEERRLRGEVAALRGQLAALRARGDAASRPTTPAALAAGEPGGAAGALAVPPLAFDVSAFVCIGSPLGLFLALRQINPAAGRGLGTPAAAALAPSAGCGGDGLPVCRRWFNLYHPYDPIAYRVEPRACPPPPPRPVAAPRAGGARLGAGLRVAAEDAAGAVSAGAAAAAGALAAGFRSLRRGAAAAAAAAGVRVERVPPAGGDGDTAADADADVGAEAALGVAAATALRRVVGQLPNPSPPGAPPPPRTAAGRLDFALQTGATEAAYLSALSAHFGYWGSPDVALFVLRAVRGVDVRAGFAAGFGVAPAPAPVASPGRRGTGGVRSGVASHALAGV